MYTPTIKKTIIMRPLLLLRAIVFGLLLMLFFGLCHVIGVADQIELRFFNILILGAGLWFTLYAKALKGDNFGVKYFSGLKDGVLFSFIASLVFSVSFYLYLLMRNFNLVDQLVAKGVITEAVTSLHLSGLIIIETCISGFMLSFIMMQFLKSKKKKEEELVYSSGSSS